MHRYFEGWYFKQQSGQGCTALIPAFHIDSGKSPSASIQVVTENSAYCIDYPFECFSADRHSNHVMVGTSVFTGRGMDLDIHSNDLSVKGSLRFGPLTPIHYDIMGPFRFVPFMECRHSVISMHHSVDGKMTINGACYDFTDGTGYIESDRGSSFPKRYAWTQCSWQENEPCSLMLSVADIPFLGGQFTGIICIVLYKGKEYRLATYLGAKLKHLANGKIIVAQGDCALTAELLGKNEFSLRAPVSGSMSRLIRENPSCAARYSFAVGSRCLFDFTASDASFEYEYDR